MNVKIGSEVAVCHDGKYIRRVKGVVVATRNGHHIKVRFTPPGHDEPIEFWARKRPVIRYRKTSGFITWHARKAHFAGWADIEYFCPWFTVKKWHDLEKC